MAGVLELSDPLRDVYLALVRLGDLSMEEIVASLAGPDSSPDEVAVYVRILVRQGHVERRKDASGVVRFQAVLVDRAKKTLSDDIWNALD